MDNIICAICIEGLSGPTEQLEIAASDCGHTFHKKCISQWLGYCSQCPICKKTTSVHQLKTLYLSSSNDANIFKSILSAHTSKILLSLTEHESDVRSKIKSLESHLASIKLTTDEQSTILKNSEQQRMEEEKKAYQQMILNEQNNKIKQEIMVNTFNIFFYLLYILFFCTIWWVQTSLLKENKENITEAIQDNSDSEY